MKILNIHACKNYFYIFKNYIFLFAIWVSCIYFISSYFFKLSYSNNLAVASFGFLVYIIMYVNKTVLILPNSYTFYFFSVSCRTGLQKSTVIVAIHDMYYVYCLVLGIFSFWFISSLICWFLNFQKALESF